MTQKDFKVKNGIIASGNITSSNSGFVYDATANTLSVGGSLVALASTVNTVQGNVTSLTTSVNTIKANVDTVQSNVTSLITSVNTIKANVDSVQSNVSTNTTRINTVQSNVTSLTTSVNTIKANVDSVQSNIASTVNTVQSNVTTLTTSVNTIKANVDSVAGNVTSLTTSVNTIKANVDSVQGNVTSLTTSVNTIKANVDSVAGNVTNIINGTTAFTGNITLNRDLTVSGNLVVGGATSTIQTTDTVLKDRVITLSNGAASASFDTGLYLNRGTSGNVFVGFDESAKQFVAAYTNELAGNAVTDFTIASYANVRFNNITADGLIDGVDIALLQTGVNGIQANINAVQGNVATVATSVNTVQGNVTTLTTSVNTIKANVDSVAGNVTSLTTSVNTIKANVDSVQSNVASITSGSTAFTGNISAPRIILNTQLQIGSNVTSSVGAGATTVFTFPGATYRGVDLTLLVQDVTNSQYQLSKMLIVHNGTVVDFTEYAMLSTNNNDLTGFTAAIDGSSVVTVVSTGGSANKKITVSAQYIIQ